MKIKINLSISRALWQTNTGLYFSEVCGWQPNTISLLYTTWDIDPCPFRAKTDTLSRNSWQNTHKSPYFVEEEVLVILHLHIPTTIAEVIHFRPEHSLTVYKLYFVPVPDEALVRRCNTKRPQKDFSEISTWTTRVHKSWQSAHNSDKSGKRCTMPFPIQSAHS